MSNLLVVFRHAKGLVDILLSGEIMFPLVVPWSVGLSERGGTKMLY